MLLRLCSMGGMGGLFLLISPKLRGSVMAGLGEICRQMEIYAPFSYIGGAVAVLAALIFSFNRGARPR